MPFKVLVTIKPGHSHVTELTRDIATVEVATDVAKSYNDQTGLETLVVEHWGRRNSVIGKFPAVSLEERILLILKSRADLVL